MAPTIPSVHGAWRGEWRATRCTAPGFFGNPIDCLFLVETGTAVLKLAQDGTALRATVTVCDVEATGFTGTIDAAGAFTLTGTGTSTSTFFPDYSLTLSSWEASTNSVVIAGSFACEVARGGRLDYSVTADLIGLTRYSLDPNAF